MCVDIFLWLNIGMQHNYVVDGSSSRLQFLDVQIKSDFNALAGWLVFTDVSLRKK